MTPLESLRTQLGMYASLRQGKAERPELAYPSVEELVLREGAVYPRSAAPPPIRPIPRACFDQAYRLATKKNSRWVYCEGYAVSENPGPAVHHAWVTRRDQPGEAIDLAWPEGTSETTAYLGIAFRSDFVRKVHLRSGRTFYSVLDAWWVDYPLITGEVRLEEVRWGGV